MININVIFPEIWQLTLAGYLTQLACQRAEGNVRRALALAFSNNIHLHFWFDKAIRLFTSLLARLFLDNKHFTCNWLLYWRWSPAVVNASLARQAS